MYSSELQLIASAPLIQPILNKICRISTITLYHEAGPLFGEAVNPVESSSLVAVENAIRSWISTVKEKEARVVADSLNASKAHAS